MMRVPRPAFVSRPVFGGLAICVVLVGMGTLAVSRPVDPPSVVLIQAPASQPVVQPVERIAVTPVDRSSKGDRLPLAQREGASPVAAISSDGERTVAIKGETAARPAAPARAMPRGCLSAVGGIISPRVGEMFAVCVADISMIKD